MEKKILLFSLLILLVVPVVNNFVASMNVWLRTYHDTGSIEYANRRASRALSDITDPIGTILYRGRHTWYTRVASMLIIAFSGVGKYYAAFAAGFTIG